MDRKEHRGYSLMELVVGMMLVGMALVMIVPRGQTTKATATTKVAAEELVARLRQARQTAMTKSIPVAVAFPVTDSLWHTDEAFFLEGEVNPRVTDRWKIQQPYPEVAYYVGSWSGPGWAPAPVMETASKNFNPATWFHGAPAPSARMFIFTPSGNAVSAANAADGKFRILVGTGIQGGPSLTAIGTPFTVWISPSGEVGMERGVHGNPDMYESHDKSSAPLASFVAPPAVPNRSPEVQIVPPKTVPGPKAYPDSVNPKTNNGTIIDIEGVLTLEVRVKDADGDPPYFHWKAKEAGILQDNGSFTVKTGDAALAEWGGRFSNVGEVRMEWDPETQEWVGRDTWAPATGDLGGNRYKLECTIRDRKGGETKTGFPVDGHYLVTTNEPWVLYKTWNSQNRSELWKMTVDGLDHTLVCSFPYQDVHYGQWTPSGAEIIVGAADGVYRVTSDGARKKIVPVDLEGGTMDGCCLSPQGDAVFYAYGKDYQKKIRKVYIDGSGIQRTIPLAPEPPDGSFSPPSDPNPLDKVGTLYDLSSAKFGNKTILLASYYHYNKSSGFLGTGLFAKKKKYRGAILMDADTGDRTSYKSPGTWHEVGMRNNKYPPYGVSFAKTKDPAADNGVHVLYGSPEGNIHIRRMATSNSPLQGGFTLGGYAHPVLQTGRGDVHHPKYANPDQNALVFVAGRDTAAKIYYMPDINSPMSNRELPLAPGNIGAEQPSVSRPQPRS
jgi:type II secretory pathway pseudopilin PulG